ncbi:MAG: ribulose-phosphate 3-epimerase [Spirochaetes bacterium]|nr:ribulose-phosphate 3-epimerase [Spirochaetota bacterium]
MTDIVLLSPSIIATDLTTLGSVVSSFDSTCIHFLHIDVMDGNFVPNLTIGPGYIQNLKQHTDIPLDVHLMIQKPELSLQQYIECKPYFLTIHYESTQQPVRLLHTIRNASIKAGISINPSTPVESLYDILEYTDMVLIMSVEPGFYGQKFIASSLKRIEKLFAFITTNNLNVSIEVDGGINEDTIADVVKAGAQIIVAGSAVFTNDDFNARAKKLLELAKKAKQ